MGAYITRAMRAFAQWASDRPVRLVLLTVLSAHLLAPVAAALLIVDALRRGPGPSFSRLTRPALTSKLARKD